MKKIKYHMFFNTACIITLFCMLYFCTNSSIWFDEAFSIELIHHPYREVVELTALDVHPPLYYILLKFFTSSLSQCISLFGFNLSDIILSKLFSFICVLLIILVQLFFGKSIFKEDNTLCCMLIVTSFSILSLAVEIRMYSLAALWILLAFYSTYGIYKYNKTLYYVILFFASIAAAYTHYFCCLAVFILYFYLYILLFIRYLKYKRVEDKFSLLKVPTTGFIVIILYLPWLTILLKQIKDVSSGYWIQPILRSQIIDYFINSLGTKFAIGILMGIVLFFIFEQIHSKTKNVLPILIISVPYMVMFLGIVISYIFRPIFVIRYMWPSVLLVFVGITMILNYKHNSLFNKIYCAFTILLVISSLVNVTTFFQNERTIKNYSHTLEKYMLTIPDNTPILCDSYYVACDLSALTGRVILLESPFENDVYRRVFSNVQEMTALNSDIYMNDNIYYFSTKSPIEMNADAVGEFIQEGHLYVYRKRLIL